MRAKDLSELAVEYDLRTEQGKLREEEYVTWRTKSAKLHGERQQELV